MGHLVPVFIEDEYPVNRRLHEGLEKGGFPEKRLFRLFAHRDVAVDTPVTHEVAAAVKYRHAAGLEDGFLPIFAVVGVLETRNEVRDWAMSLKRAPTRSASSGSMKSKGVFPTTSSGS